MRLPDRIEHEIVAIEQQIAAETRQMAGPPRLRGLRMAIEDFIRDNEVYYPEADPWKGPNWVGKKVEE